MRTGLVVVLAGLALAGPAEGARASHPARVTAPCSSSPTDFAPAAASTVFVSGTLRSKTRRPVVLLRRHATGWTRLAKARTRADGTFRLAVTPRAAGPLTLRVVAPRTRRHRRLACRALTLTAVAPEPPPQPVTITASRSAPGDKPSFRAVYALAAGQWGDFRYPAAIMSTIEAVNGWYAGQTTGGVHPRWVRSADGRPQIDVVRLPRTATEYAAGGIELVKADLHATWPGTSTEVDVVWMDTHAHGYCGATSYEPTLVYLPEEACGIRPGHAQWPHGQTYLLAHELAHAFGARHHSDDPHDVLYEPTSGAPPRDWARITLDPGQDDYFQTGRAGDIATSPLWTATNDPGS